MNRALCAYAAAVGFALSGAGCAGWDNPTALADLAFTADFELSVAEAQTFEEIEVHVHPHEGGRPITVRHAELELRHETSGETVIVSMEPEGDGYAAHVMFYQPGAYHLHMLGTPGRHTLQWEMGEMEVDVVRRHLTIGSYWVELSASPAPVLEQTAADLHFHMYELLQDGTRGAPVSGLAMQLEIHAPGGGETLHTLDEHEPGEYEASHLFGAAGEYELHVEIETLGGPVAGELHFPVLAPTPQDDGQGGGGHDH